MSLIGPAWKEVTRSAREERKSEQLRMTKRGRWARGEETGELNEQGELGGRNSCDMDAAHSTSL